MARGGRVICKRTGGRNQKTQSNAASDDGGDDEYVLGEEDEESESFEESYASSPDASEEEFEFGESSSDTDKEEEEIEEEEEEEEIELARSKPQRAASNVWREIKKTRVLDNEEDEVSVPRKRERGGSGRKKSNVSDYEEEGDDNDDDDGDTDFSPDEDEEEEEEEEEEVSLIASRKRGYGRRRDSKWGRKKRKSGVLKQKREKKTATAPMRKRRRKALISDGDDDDFTVKVKDLVAVDRKRNKSKKRRRKALISDEDDDDFTVKVKDLVAVDKKRKKSKKGRRKKTMASRTTRNGSPVDSDTSDWEYVTSDDEFEEKDRIASDHRRKKRKRGRKKAAAAPRTRRRNISSSSSSAGSDSESSDCDDVISEEELRDLGVGGFLSQPRPKRIFGGRKGEEEKGKEKEANEGGKPVCGICLSVEQKGTVRGVLNCCAHYFCFACIIEWSKVESRCPVCKRRFTAITKYLRPDRGFGLRKIVIRVQKRDQVYQPSEEEIRSFLDPYANVVCMECHQDGDDNLMLLCDICDSPAHTYCVGLGREVPEGNWYCLLCRSAGEGSSYSQVQDTPTNQGGSSGNLFPGIIETEDVSRNARSNMNSQRSMPLAGQSSQRIDLNVSPRHFMENDRGGASQASGGGASTLSGRRARQRRIRILLSNSRPRQVFTGINVPTHNVESDAITSGIERSMEAPTGVVNLLHPLSSIEQHQQNIRPFQSSDNLAPCTYGEGNNLRHVEDAKEEVQSMVKLLNKLVQGFSTKYIELTGFISSGFCCHDALFVPLLACKKLICLSGTDVIPFSIIETYCLKLYVIHRPGHEGS